MGELTDNHKTLLALGLSRGEPLGDGKYMNTLLKAEDAAGLYSNSDTGHDALVTLVFKGYIDITDVPGRFVIIKAPSECELRANQLREKRKEKEKHIQTALC